MPSLLYLIATKIRLIATKIKLPQTIQPPSSSRVTFFLCSVFAVLVTFPRASAASPAEDFYIQQAMGRYYSLPHDAKTLSLGGAPGTVCSGPQCLYLNPAGTGRVKNIAVAGSLGTGQISGEEFLEESDITQEQHEGFLSLSIPIGGQEDQAPLYGTFLLGYSRYRGTTDDSINTTPDGHRRSIGYGLVVDESVTLGYGFHFYDDQLRTDLADLHSHSRFLHVFGADISLSENTQLGVVLQYGLGQSDTEDFSLASDGLSKPRQYSISIGALHKFDRVGLYLSQDFSKLHSKGNLSDISSPAVVIGSDEAGYVTNSRLGVEFMDLAQFSLRSGIRYQWAEYTFDRSDLQSLTGHYSTFGISGGVGYTFTKSVGDPDAVRVDYGIEYAWLGDGSWEHLVSVIIPFSFF